MSSLANQQIKSTFSGILQVPGGVTSSLQTVQDGDGNPTGLQLSLNGTSAITADNFTATRNGTPITGAEPRLISDGFGDLLSVKDFGAVGDGITDDTAAINTAITQLAAIGGGVLYFPAGTYLLATTTTVNGIPTHFAFSDLSGISFIGYGATLKSTYSSAILQGVIFALNGARRVSFEGFDFEGLFDKTLAVVSDYSVGVFDLRSSTRDAESISLKNIRAIDTYYFLIVRATTASNRVRSVSVENCFAQNNYYGLNFQENGDNVTAINFRTNLAVRSYFPYGVTNHNIQYTSTNGDAFTDCLIKAYINDTTDIYVKAKIINNTSADAKCSIESQHNPSTQPVAAKLVNIRVDFDDSKSSGAKSIRFAYWQDTPTPTPTPTSATQLFNNIVLSGYARNDFDIAVDQGVSGLISIDSLAGGANFPQTVFDSHGFYRLQGTVDSTCDPDKLLGALSTVSANTLTPGNVPYASNWAGLAAGGTYANIQFLQDATNNLYTRIKRGTNPWSSWANHPDSETGTWNPALQFGGNATGLTYTASGLYNRIGNIVYVAADITLSNKGSSTGAATITGLPFAVQTSNYSTNTVVFYSGATGLTSPVFALTDSLANNTKLFTQGATGVTTVTDTTFTNTTRFLVSMVYSTQAA